jgi:hypothetical protein
MMQITGPQNWPLVALVLRARLCDNRLDARYLSGMP